MSKIENRELSWIKFNTRVLEEAANRDNPILERGKFISICESNLDEFFMVRVGSLVRSCSLGGKMKKDPAGMTPQEQLDKVWEKVRKQVARQYDLLQNDYIPELKNAGIYFLKPAELSGDQKAYISDYYDREVQPLLTPRAIDDRRPFPLLAAKAIHIAVMLPPQSRGAAPRMALVPMPGSINRVVMFPMGQGRARGIMLEDVIAMHIDRLFSGVKPMAVMPFRITRNTDFVYNDDNAEELIVEMRKNLKRRKWGKVVRMQIMEGADAILLSRLKKYLDITDREVIAVNGPLNPNYFMKQIADLEGMDDLRFPGFTPYVNPRFNECKDVFEAIRQGDLFFHHPYDSFEPVVRFVQQAADDPDVLAIKQTLYRVSGKSPIVAALSRAAQAGKQVTVLIEVRARFDEENNINWCLELEKAGCQVFYGVPNLKCHSKITMVVRREAEGLRRYVHLSTGNYNDSTAKLYTDMGLMTCDEAIGRDAATFFNTITGLVENVPMEKLVAAPDRMRDTLEHLIKQETENAKEGKRARIIAKMNSLLDPKIVKLLYKAEEAGVEIDLIVRGICVIKTKGHPGIHVRSIVGRFLEHARVFVFYNGGERLVYLASADWMPRNLDKRVELMFPIDDVDIQNRVIATLKDEMRDSLKAWQMKKNGKYERVERKEPLLNCQENRILGPAQLMLEEEPEAVEKPAEAEDDIIHSDEAGM